MSIYNGYSINTVEIAENALQLELNGFDRIVESINVLDNNGILLEADLKSAWAVVVEKIKSAWKKFTDWVAEVIKKIKESLAKLKGKIDEKVFKKQAQDLDSKVKELSPKQKEKMYKDLFASIKTKYKGTDKYVGEDKWVGIDFYHIPFSEVSKVSNMFKNDRLLQFKAEIIDDNINSDIDEKVNDEIERKNEKFFEEFIDPVLAIEYDYKGTNVSKFQPKVTAFMENDYEYNGRTPSAVYNEIVDNTLTYDELSSISGDNVWRKMITNYDRALQKLLSGETRMNKGNEGYTAASISYDIKNMKKIVEAQTHYYYVVNAMRIHNLRLLKDILDRFSVAVNKATGRSERIDSEDELIKNDKDFEDTYK